MREPTYQDDPRAFALDLVSEGIVSADHLLLCALKSMSHDDVRWMLDANELSPRFDEDEDEDEDEGYEGDGEGLYDHHRAHDRGEGLGR